MQHKHPFPTEPIRSHHKLSVFQKILRSNTAAIVLRLLPAILIVGISLTGYAMNNHGLGSHSNFIRNDTKDYLNKATQFWFIHDPSVQGASVPTREIGVGTFYFLNAWLFGKWNNVSLVMPNMLNTWIPVAFVLLLSISYFFFYWAVERRFGLAPAIISLAFLVFPTSTWSITQSLLTEPLLRIMFVNVIAMTLSFDAQSHFPFVSFTLLTAFLIMTVHIKSQWLFLAAVVSAIILLRYLPYLLRHPKSFVLAILLSLSIPLSLSLFHHYGWGTYALSAGAAGHLNLKTHGSYLKYFCHLSDGPLPAYCQHLKQWYGHFGIYDGTGVTSAQIIALDKKIFSFALLHLSSTLQGFRKAIVIATNFPYRHSLRWLFHSLDLFTWIVLSIGVFFRRTSVLSITALSLWVCVAIANMLALFDWRYFTPMEGLPIAAACIVLCLFLEKAKGFLSSKLRERMMAIEVAA